MAQHRQGRKPCLRLGSTVAVGIGWSAARLLRLPREAAASTALASVLTIDGLPMLLRL